MSRVQILSDAPRRSKVRFAPFFFAEKHPPASLLLLFRKRSRSRRLCICKRTHNAFGSLPTFCGMRLTALLLSLFLLFCEKSRSACFFLVLRRKLILIKNEQMWYLPLYRAFHGLLCFYIQTRLGPPNTECLSIEKWQLFILKNAVNIRRRSTSCAFLRI